jgi:hypothetical protein
MLIRLFHATTIFNLIAIFSCVVSIIMLPGNEVPTAGWFTTLELSMGAVAISCMLLNLLFVVVTVKGMGKLVNPGAAVWLIIEDTGVVIFGICFLRFMFP